MKYDIEFKNRKFLIKENEEGVTNKNHCDFCDFKDLCEQYVDEFEWIACGCIFHIAPIYLKEIYENS